MVGRKYRTLFDLGSLVGMRQMRWTRTFTFLQSGIFMASRRQLGESPLALLLVPAEPPLRCVVVLNRAVATLASNMP